MGFLQRILSIGNKKKAKLRHEAAKSTSHLGQIPEEGDNNDDDEVMASRLLRSSSARFAVVSELDCSSLPPLPHPIDDVLRSCAASTDSLCSTTKHSAYNVTVHRPPTPGTSLVMAEAVARYDDTTPKPNSNPTHARSTPSDGRLTPQDQNRLHVLRSDPSVASLVQMYDAKGRLHSQIFSNSPPHSPRYHDSQTRTRKTGFTLRQLLGTSSSLCSNSDDPHASVTESDASWAERYLDEKLSTRSSLSSVGLTTPSDAQFTFDSPIVAADDRQNFTFTSDADFPTNGNAVSSMEVEVSDDISESVAPYGAITKDNAREGRQQPYAIFDPTSPQRASQIFSFLTEKRQYLPTTSLPAPPSPLPSPTTSHFSSSDTSFDRSNSSEGVLMSAERRSVFAQAHSAVATPLPALCTTMNMAQSHVTQAGEAWPEQMRIPKTGQNRIPRGPRPSGQIWKRFNHLGFSDASRAAGPSDATVYADVPADALIHIPCWTDDDPFTRMPPRVSRDRKSSVTSTSPLEGEAQDSPNPFIEKTDRSEWEVRNWRFEDEKANYDFYSQLPDSPVRSRSLPALRLIPSPASSSELSPVTQQLMSNLRENRTKAKRAERKRGKMPMRV